MLVGCGGNNDSPDSTSRPAATPDSGQIATLVGLQLTSTALVTLPPEIGQIVWASEIDPVTAAPVVVDTQFPVSTSVLYATVPVKRLRQGSQLGVSWWYNSTSLDAFGQTAVLSSDYPDGWLEFHLTRNAATEWPDGIYEIAIMLDGMEVQRSSIPLVEVAESP